MRTTSREAVLLLEDGLCFRGHGWGADATTLGELVFNTAHTGYEEVLTDPSYAGQIVVFTTSHLGNTGITREDAESSRVFAEGVVCKDFTPQPDSFRSRIDLSAYLREQGRPVISGIDTRALTLHLREKGCLRAILSTEKLPDAELRARLTAFARTPLPAVLHRSENGYAGPMLPLSASPEALAREASDVVRARGARRAPHRIAVLDFGIKKGIAHGLAREGLELHFFSPFASVSSIKAIQPDGLFLSNGPGDPRDVLESTPVRATLEALTPGLPTFGICMGHQLLALRYGARIRKLKFGHHAVNHPVRELNSGHVGYITSQNHNFVAEVGDVTDLTVSHVHLNDGTVAGLRHATHPVFSVQFHPECNPGPHDAWGLFTRFATTVERFAGDSRL